MQKSAYEMRISDWSSDVCSSDLPHREQNRKRLPDRIIQPCVANLFQIDGIGLAENVAAFLTHFARNANSKPWPRKGMPTDKDVRQAQFTAQLTHLILEQFAQRFNQLHVHAVGKAANIMMALDRYRWPAGKADAFNDIWVKSALCQEIGSPDLACFFFEHINEGPADELSLGFGISDALEPVEEQSFRVYMNKGDIIGAPE